MRHPLVFKHHRQGNTDFDYFPPRYKEGEYFRDNWDCLWYCPQGGLEGQVVEHPLADWKVLDTYRMPDPLKEHDTSFTEPGNWAWEEEEKNIEGKKKKGVVTGCFGGRLFDRLYFLRGFENLMLDIATDDPHLPRLIEMLLDHELKLVNKWLSIGVDTISFHTDIGTQNSLMISPAKFRQYIKPMFKEIFTACRKAGAHVYLSSDGRLLEIVDDLVECGVSMHDPQLRANTLDGIAKAYKGKMCINLDLDRQMFPFCSPEDIMSQVREVVERLDSPEGGLMVLAGIYGADVSLENIEAICRAFEEFCL